MTSSPADPPPDGPRPAEAPAEPAPELVEGAAADAYAHRIPPWAPFTFSDYRLFWLGSLCAMFTNQLLTLVPLVWLFEETHSAAQLGLVGGVQLIVQVPGLLYGGTLADTLDRKKLMAWTQGFTAIVLGVLAALAVSHHLVPWHIYASTAVLSITSVIGQPARAAITARVVPRTHLMHAITANTLTQQVGSIIAPLTFAWIVARWGLNPAWVMSAVTAVPAAILPLMIQAEGRAPNLDTSGSMPRRVIEGFQYVRGHGVLPGLFWLDVGMTVPTFYRQLLPALASGLFGAGPAAVGLLTSVNSAGAVAGALVVLFTARFRAKGMLVVWATFAFCISVFLFGSVTSLLLGGIIIFSMGATDAISMVTRQTMMQLTTPDQMLGRTLSLGSLVATTANNAGTLWVGFLAAGIGAAATMQIGGAVALLVSIVVWRAVEGLRTYRYP
ncbi:MAG: MFS transporter [Dehalococcoidia bacterium]|nr:MFS transporter [Dehalococcoidia bacterium]